MTVAFLNPYRYAAGPDAIAGLKAWYKADGVLWQDSARTTPATADGDPVGSWDDASGVGTHAIQATSTKRPLLKTGILNAKPVLRFDGVDDFLAAVAFGAALAQPNTIFAVYTNGTNAAGEVITDGDSASRHQLAARGAAYAGGAQAGMYAGTVLAGGASYAGATSRIFAAKFNGASSKLWVDGGAAKVTGDAGAASWARVVLGTDSLTPGTQFLHADLAEVLVYNAGLTTCQLDSVGGYLATKYGLTWAASS